MDQEPIPSEKPHPNPDPSKIPGSAMLAIPGVPVELGVGRGEVSAEGAPELGGGLQVPAVHHHHPAIG